MEGGAGADKAGGGGSRSTFPAGSPGAEAGSGVFVFSLVFVFGRAGSFRRERSGPRLRARTSVRAEDAPVLARCLFTTSRRCRSRCRLVHQPLTVVRIARSVARRPRQTAEKSWPSENCVDSITARNITVRMMMIEPMRLKYSARRVVRSAPR